MMRTAVIDPETGAVVNVIVADPKRDSLPGKLLVAAPDDSGVDTRWVWSAAEGFKPGPELQAEIDAQAAAIEQEGVAFYD